MSVNPGDLLGPYEVIASLGAGGMGEVYRARDTKLNRDVALKILPEVFASDPDRLMRFTREAQALAALNHPNIAAIYGIEGDGSPAGIEETRPPVRAIVMELVEGRDLSEVIAAGSEDPALRRSDGAPGLQPRGLPLDEALPVARQIAEALEAAHEAGIIHRDLKPANVKVRHDGTVKVLDFGLAKAIEGDGSGLRQQDPSLSSMNSPTMTSPALTAMGLVLGTATYMAPEQAKGKPVDRRADIWAFGVLLYEMLTGRQLFQAETVGEVLAAVLRADIDLTVLPGSTPVSVRRLVGRCLDRDVKTRLQHIGEARIALQAALADPRVDAAPDASGRWAMSRGGMVAAAVLAMAAGGLGWWAASSGGQAGSQSDPIRAEIVTASPTQFRRTSMAITSDGRTLVFAAETDSGSMLFRRNLDEPDIIPIAGSEGGRAPFLSPDNAWVGFSTTDAMKKVRLEGGTAETIRDWSQPGAIDVVQVTWDRSGLPYGAAWLPDHTIAYGRFAGGLWRVSEDGGAPTPLTTLDDASEFAHRLPHLSPDGRHLTFTSLGGMMSRGTVELLELTTGKRTVLVSDASDGRLTSSGHLLFARQGELFAARVDAATLVVSGEPVRVLSDVRHFVRGGNPSAATGAADFAHSSTGTLVFRSGGVIDGRQHRLAWLDRSDTVEELFLPAQPLLAPALSPDGRQVLVGSPRGLLRVDLDLQFETVLLPPQGVSGGGGWPVWGHDQTGVLFSRDDGIRSVAFDRPDDERTVVEGAYPLWPSHVSADGRWLFYVETHPVTGNDIWVVGLEPASPARAILQTSADEGFPVLSPDGRWLAYSVAEGGSGVAYVQPFPGPGERVPVSSGRGRRLGWMPLGDGLLSAGQQQVFITAIDASGSRVVVGRTETFSTQRSAGSVPVGALHVDRTTGRLLSAIPANLDPTDPATPSGSMQLITNATALFDGGRK